MTNIPDKDLLYRWIINIHVVDGVINQAHFALKNNEKDLSAEWAKLVSNPNETRYRMTNHPNEKIRWPEEFAKKHGVISLVTKNVKLLELDVVHTPRDWNPAHTSINKLDQFDGAEALDKRRQLAKVAQLELEPIEK